MSGTGAERPVVVDMFCGSGGECQGIDWSAKTAGVKLEMFAINHWVRSIHEPLATVVTKEEACLIEPLIFHHRAQGAIRPASESPLSTLTTFGWVGLVEPLLMNYYGNGTCEPISKPVPPVTTKDRFALITPENCRIGFRMLKPHELAAAQSFPKDYIFTGNRGEIVKQIGNAVCPKVAGALTLDYMRELAGVEV